ncbi:hypothetical protein Glove_1033g22 [Diversispora epigaea]|uniref:Uncharacterized protein n=1 Tax=Diversispora epigaea TaxID=1348612 RepID=A0A397G5Z1_9GLOM|nr:hypothetical protein Glove_1033g22 [Diversispora epigaea]
MVQCKVLEDLFGADVNGQERISNERVNKDTTDLALEFLATVIWNMFEVDRNAYRIVDETILCKWTSEHRGNKSVALSATFSY